MKKLSLVQPRHTFAPGTGLGHVYLPGALLHVASRVLQAGGEVELQDANLRPRNTTHVVYPRTPGEDPVSAEIREKMNLIGARFDR